MKDKKLGEILVEFGVVTEMQCAKALHYQQEHGGLIGEVLVRLGYIDNEDLTIALSEQHYDMELKLNITEICKGFFRSRP